MYLKVVYVTAVRVLFFVVTSPAIVEVIIANEVGTMFRTI
jgi:hypothetical protein